MTRRAKVYRSVVKLRREPEQKLAGLSCGHQHSTPDAATKCLAARLRDIGRHPMPPIELTAHVEYSHSRHDWFPL